jgi:two-component system chemotaxis response regulator CheB
MVLNYFDEDDERKERMTKKIRVLIVDDSAFIRHILTSLLSQDPEIEVIGSAIDPYDAREKIKILNPDVITLDIEMPRMNGIEFLEKLMRLRPMPVVMLSTLTQKGADITLKALELGAVDYIAKPIKNFEENMESFKKEVIEKVKIASQARVSVLTNDISHDQISSEQNHMESSVLKGFEKANSSRHIIAIGSSTGGVEALTKILSQLPKNSPAIVIAQHMPSGFTNSFAKRLNAHCAINVVEAENHMRIESGTAYIAPGNAHLCIENKNGYVIRLDENTPLVSGHRPSVDVLFESVSKNVGKMASGFILTGMGKDGAQGLKMMRDMGCKTFGQNEASCVVYGMPKMAFLNGAVEKEVHLNEISTIIMQLCM